MPTIRLPRPENESPAFLFRLEHILEGALRFTRPTYVHFVRIDNWFGAKWCGFVGSKHGPPRTTGDLYCPPFAPARVLSERAYRRVDRAFHLTTAQRLHASPHERPVGLSAIADSGLFAWYSANTATQDRGSLMVYEVGPQSDSRAWYAELRCEGDIWSLASTSGIGAAELEDLETSYSGRLAPFANDELQRRRESNFRIWAQARDAFDDGKLAVARLLAERYVQLEPTVRVGRFLLADVQIRLRQFDAAEELLAGIGALRTRRARAEAAYLWADLCELTERHGEAEQHYRELAQVFPDETDGWILLGAYLARRGKIEESASIHRHATTLRGYPDEAFLNLALICRALGQLEEAAEACRSALELCPDYPEAAAVLADVEAALELELALDEPAP